MEIKQKRLRCYEKLPVIICEWHQHVLPFIHRGIASRHLPSTGLQILHFDAHPDLTFPVNKPAADCFDKDALYDQIEIADWILPLCFEGHLNRIIWVKPQWAEQIKHGDYFVQVGEDKVNGCLRFDAIDSFIQLFLGSCRTKLDITWRNFDFRCFSDYLLQNMTNFNSCPMLL